MDAIDQFAAEVTLFEQWARYGNDRGNESARTALIRITRLYLAALILPSAWSEELADQSNAVGITDDEWKTVYAASARMPFNCYGVVFDPLVVPPEQPVVGSLADDIADIYRDVVSGRNEYQSRRRSQAVWEWSFGFQHHWGDHATSAIRALHAWLAANAPDCLTNST